MATGVTVGPLSFVVENTVAARIMQAAAAAWKAEKLELSRTLRKLAAKVEVGTLEEAEGLRLAGLKPATVH